MRLMISLLPQSVTVRFAPPENVGPDEHFDPDETEVHPGETWEGLPYLELRRAGPGVRTFPDPPE